MKLLKIILFFLLIFFIAGKLDYAGSLESASFDTDKIENAIIIKGIENTDNTLNECDIDNPKGRVIYNNSFDDIHSYFTDKQTPNKSLRKNEHKVNFLEVLRKEDNRWHFTSHKILKNENLWTIAKKYQTDYKKIIKANNVCDPDRLSPGNTIFVPNKIGINYKICKNETLNSVSKKYKIRKDIIVAQNGIKNSIIKEGKFLFIPDAIEESRDLVRFSKIRKNMTSEPSEQVAIDDIISLNKSEDNNPEFSWPVKGQITSAFGKRNNPIDDKQKFHCGLDISVSIGTPVRAAADGEVIFSGWKKGYGRVVILKHIEGYITVYAHNRKNLTETGVKLKKDDIIALSGMSGAVTGPHLHFEIRKYLTPLNPLRFLI